MEHKLFTVTAAAGFVPNAGNSSVLVSGMLGCKSFYQLESLTELLKKHKTTSPSYLVLLDSESC